MLVNIPSGQWCCRRNTEPIPMERLWWWRKQNYSFLLSAPALEPVITLHCAFLCKTVELSDVERLTEGQPGVADLQVHINISSEADAVVGQSGVFQGRVLIIAVPDTWEWRETEWSSSSSFTISPSLYHPHSYRMLLLPEPQWSGPTPRWPPGSVREGGTANWWPSLSPALCGNVWETIFYTHTKLVYHISEVLFPRPGHLPLTEGWILRILKLSLLPFLIIKARSKVLQFQL